MFDLVVCIVLLLVVDPLLTSETLPANFVKCPKKDNKCIGSAIEKVLHELPEGLASVALGATEPVSFPTLVIGAGKGAVHFTQNYGDIKVRGISKCSVENTDFDPEKKILKFTAIVPELVQDADYEMSGQIMVMPVEGKGRSYFTLYKAKLVNTLTFKEVEKSGKKYWDVTDWKLGLSANKINFKFENLFHGNKELSANLHNVFNDNWSEIFEDVKPSYDDAYGKIFGNIARQFFMKTPIDQIFTL